MWFRATWFANLCISLAAVGLFLSLLDPFVMVTQANDLTRFEGSWTHEYHFVDDPDLGYVLPAGVVAESRRYLGDHLDYDVTYSIDTNGNRVTAGSSDPAADSVLFMGDSFTFGMGLNDDQAVPQLFSQFTGKATLDKANIAYIPVRAIIPDLLSKASVYRITPMDGHPTAAANRLIAAYLAKRFTDGAIAQ